MSTKGNVAIVGAGPAGLLSAWAAVQAGYQVLIYTNVKRPTVQQGAQYIHMEIPGITVPDEMQYIHYSHIGDARGYAMKIYGEGFNPADTSWSKFEGTLECWSMNEVYRRLWSFFEDAIFAEPIDYSRLQQLARNFDVVFSSMPLTSLFEMDFEAFVTEKIYTYPRMITPAFKQQSQPNVIVYNGSLASGWYRQSRIFGREWTEWSGRFGADGVQEEMSRYGWDYNPLSLMQAVKPVRCTLPLNLLLPPNVRLVGRYGQWRKGVLAHEAYVDTLNYLEELSEVSEHSSMSERAHQSRGASSDY